MTVEDVSLNQLTFKASCDLANVWGNVLVGSLFYFFCAPRSLKIASASRTSHAAGCLIGSESQTDMGWDSFGNRSWE